MSTDPAPPRRASRTAVCSTPAWTWRSPVPSPARWTIVASRPCARSAAASGSRSLVAPPYPGTRRTGGCASWATGVTSAASPRRARTATVPATTATTSASRPPTNLRRAGERALSTTSVCRGPQSSHPDDRTDPAGRASVRVPVNGEAGATHARPPGSDVGGGWPEPSGGALGSAAGNRRDHRDLGAVGRRRLEVVEEADVVVADVHVHEAAQVALLVDDAPLDPGVVAVEVVEDLGQRRTLGRHLGLTTGVGAQDGRDADGHAHQ